MVILSRQGAAVGVLHVLNNSRQCPLLLPARVPRRQATTEEECPAPDEKKKIWHTSGAGFGYTPKPLNMYLSAGVGSCIPSFLASQAALLLLGRLLS